MNYSRNWNKILELSNGKVDEIASNRFIGEPLNVLRDYIHTDVITDKGVTMHTKDGIFIILCKNCMQSMVRNISGMKVR